MIRKASLIQRASAILLVASLLSIALSPTLAHGGLMPALSPYPTGLSFNPPGEWVAEKQDGFYRASGEICNDTFTSIRWVALSSKVERSKEHLVEKVKLIYTFSSMREQKCYPLAVEVTMTDAWSSEPNGAQVRVFIDAEAYT